MRTPILLCLAVLAFPVGGAAQGRDSAAVVETVRSFHAALAAGDSTKALSLLADDAVVLESGGIETRLEYRAHHLPGDIRFAMAVRSTRGPMSVVIQGDVAWAWSTNTAEGQMGNRTINSTGAELVVLSRTPAGWRIRAVHWSSRTRRPPP